MAHDTSREVPAHEAPETDGRTGMGDPSTGPTIAWGIVMASLVFVMVVGLEALFYSVQEDEYQRKIIVQPPEELARLVAEQQERLHSYRWIDPKAGIVGIPIDRAMEQIIPELNRPWQGSSAGAGAPAPGGASGSTTGSPGR